MVNPALILSQYSSKTHNSKKNCILVHFEHQRIGNSRIKIPQITRPICILDLWNNFSFWNCKFNRLNCFQEVFVEHQGIPGGGDRRSYSDGANANANAAFPPMNGAVYGGKGGPLSRSSTPQLPNIKQSLGNSGVGQNLNPQFATGSTTTMKSTSPMPSVRSPPHSAGMRGRVDWKAKYLKWNVLKLEMNKKGFTPRPILLCKSKTLQCVFSKIISMQNALQC